MVLVRDTIDRLFDQVRDPNTHTVANGGDLPAAVSLLRAHHRCVHIIIHIWRVRVYPFFVCFSSLCSSSVCGVEFGIVFDVYVGREKKMDDARAKSKG